jgi:hypothetical protein
MLDIVAGIEAARRKTVDAVSLDGRAERVRVRVRERGRWNAVRRSVSQLTPRTAARFKPAALDEAKQGGCHAV